MDGKNRDTLMATLAFMKTFVEEVDLNKMTSVNMALMFAPNIFRRRKGEEGEVSMATVGLMQMHVGSMVTMHFAQQDGIEVARDKVRSLARTLPGAKGQVWLDFRKSHGERRPTRQIQWICSLLTVSC